MTIEASLNDLSGLWQALSGQVFDNEKLILGLPSKSDFNSLSSTHSSRFNTLEANVSTLQDQITELIGFIQNLALEHSQLESNFDIYTGIAENYIVTTITSSAQITSVEEVVLATGIGITITLPLATDYSGENFNIKNIGTGLVTVTGASGELIDGQLTAEITSQYDSIGLVTDGTNWYIL